MSWRDLVKTALSRAGLRLSRVPANRFDGMEDTLAQLARRGYAPRVIADAGANAGQWARRARRAFPSATLHLIEPQRGCAAELARFAGEDGRATVHRVAVTAPGAPRVRMIGGGTSGDSTGAWVARSDEHGADEHDYPATTLDALLADQVSRDDHLLLKLDLEGHEMAALSGAIRLLEAVEVVIAEVQFYDHEASGRPLFLDIVSWLDGRGFQLLDLAALASRRRDGRLRSGDVVLARRGSPLLADVAWA